MSSAAITLAGALILVSAQVLAQTEAQAPPPDSTVEPLAAAGKAEAKEAPAISQTIIAFTGGRFVIVASEAKDCVIALQGMVTRDAADGFDRVVRRANALGCNAPLTLMLESGGGSHYDGLRLGKKVRARGVRTVARYSCASACASIFLGGVERVLWGNRAAIGFHEVAEGWADESNAGCVESRDDRAARELLEYFNYVNPAQGERLFDLAMSTSCKSISWVAGQRALDMGVATQLQAQDLDVFGDQKARVARP